MDGTDRGEFGFWLGEPWHGHGFMREAAPAYVAALHARLALDHIEATCQQMNRASARLLAACGLKRTGARTLHAPARNHDERVDVWERAWTRDAQSKSLDSLDWGDPSRIYYLTKYPPCPKTPNPMASQIGEYEVNNRC